jgi:hypothetical protein
MNPYVQCNLNATHKEQPKLSLRMLTTAIILLSWNILDLKQIRYELQQSIIL